MEDHISDVPNEVLEQILSLLTLKEAVRTSLLSKKWRRMNVCSILSNMNFTDYFDIYARQKNGRKKNRRLLNVVDKFILARSRSTLSIRELSLDLIWIDTGMRKSSLELKLERWMKCLPKTYLTTLVLLMSVSDGLYDLSLSILAAARSLQNLFLCGFHLTSLSSYDIVGFLSLRSLKLWTVRVDDEAMLQLLEGCILLEILELDSIRGLKKLEIVGFCYLKMLTVICLDLETLHVDVANLEVLVLEFREDMMNMNIATCVPNLRQFEFKNHYFADPKLELRGLHLPLETWFSQFLSMCSLLEHLTLSYCPKLDNFHLPTPFLALKTLHLHILEHMTSFKIVAPNLEKLIINVDMIMPFVEVNASDKLEVEIIFYQADRFDDLFYDRLAKFFEFFNHSRGVKLSPIHGDKVYFIPKEKRIKFHSPLYNTKYLELLLVGWERKLFSEYLDYMLWLSPRATNLTIRDNNEEYYSYKNNSEIVLEFLYEENAITSGSGNCSCCKVLPLKCWRHHLKEVRIQNFVGDEADKVAIKQFLWEEIENLSIIETSFNHDSIYGGQYTSYDQLFK